VNIANTAIVGIRPTPHLIAGHLSPDDQRAVFEWILINTAALVLQRIPSRQLGRFIRSVTCSRFGDQVDEEMAATINDEFDLIPEIRGGWFPINLRDIDSRPVSPYVGRA